MFKIVVYLDIVVIKAVLPQVLLVLIYFIIFITLKLKLTEHYSISSTMAPNSDETQEKLYEKHIIIPSHATF